MDLFKKILTSLSDNMGFELIPKWRFQNINISRRIERIVSEYNVDCILDVGANEGQYYKFIRTEVEYGGLVVSFEPDENNVEILKNIKKSDNNWIVQDYALGSEENTRSLNIMNRSVFNSFLEPDSTRTTQFEEYNSVVGRRDVQVRRLDRVIEELREAYSFERVFLKTDTQGFDLEVIKGALGCIDVICGIQAEVSVLPIYKNMPSFEDSFKFLRSIGFEISGLYPLDDRFPFAVEFDCIFLRNS